MTTGPAGEAPGVVLVHGIWDVGQILRRMEDCLTAVGHEVFRPKLRPSTAKGGLPRLAGQLKEQVETRFGPERPLAFVGFSMGGLVTRYYLQRMDGLARTVRLVTMGTPHTGTWSAPFGFTDGAMQMWPHASFLRDLNADWDCLRPLRPVCIWTPWDLSCTPGWRCRLPFATNIRVNTVLHRWLAIDPSVLAPVLAALRETREKVSRP